MAETDSEAVVEDQPTETSSPGPSDDLGTSLRETYLGESEPVEEQPETAPAEETASETITEPESTDEGPMLRRDYTQKTQALADKERELVREYRELTAKVEADRQTAVDQRLQNLETPQQPEMAPLSERAQVAMTDPNIDETNRAVIGAVGENAKVTEGHSEKIATLMDFMTRAESRLDTAVKTSETFAAERVQTIRDSHEAQATEVIERFGVETAQKHSGLIKALSLGGVTNPSTQQPYTYVEAVALGEQTVLKDNAISANGKAKAAAQADAAPNGLLQGGTDGGGKWTADQAKAHIATTL